MYVWSSSVVKGAVNRIVVNARLAVPDDIPMRVTKRLVARHRIPPAGLAPYSQGARQVAAADAAAAGICISRPQPASRTGGRHTLVIRPCIPSLADAGSAVSQCHWRRLT